MDQSATSEAPTSELRNYLSVIRSRKWSVILVVALAMSAALVLSLRQTPLYRAETRLLVKPPSGDAYYVAPPDLPTEAQLAKSEPVALMVKEDLQSGRSTTSLLNSLNVDPVPESAVMKLTFVSPDANEAEQASNAFAADYITYRRAQTRAVLQKGEETLQKQIDRLERQLAQVARDQQAATAEGNLELAATLEAQRGGLIARLGVLQQRLQDIKPDNTVDLGGGEIIEAATVPTAPFSPNHTTNALLGAIAGLFLGLGLAFGRERLDERIRTRADAEEWLRSPVLATIPRHERANPKKDEWNLVSRSSPNSHVTEAYRSLRTNLQFVTFAAGIKSVLLSSPSAREGKTTTTANLAVTLAEAGKRVILLSADMRRPLIENYFQVDSDYGLSTWLASDEEEPWDIIRDPGVPNLRLIPTGQVPPNPAELLSSQRMGHLMRSLEKHSDIVLIDSPPVLAVADASILASFAGGSILLVQAGSTERAAAQRAKEELERAGRRLLGVVVNSVDNRVSGYYYAGDYYTGVEAAGEASSGPPTNEKRRFGILSRSSRKK